MSAILYILIFIVVLAAAVYSRLPLTIVCMVTIVSFLASMTPHGEPLNSILHLLRAPAQLVLEAGNQFLGLGETLTGIAILGVALAVDLLLTNALGLRK
jgi:hypothetical protein